MVFQRGRGLDSLFIEQLQQKGFKVIAVTPGQEFHNTDNGTYILNPGQNEHYHQLLQQLKAQGNLPNRIVHFWSVGNPGKKEVNLQRHELDETLTLSFYSLVYLARALGKQNIVKEIQLEVVTEGLYEITGDEVLFPNNAPILGPIKVIPQEYPFIRCRNVDIIQHEIGRTDEMKLTAQLISEFTTKISEPVIAYRNNFRWVQTYQPIRLPEVRGSIPLLKEKGVYLITGGMGKIGLTLAEYLVDSFKARLVLTGRHALPSRDQWTGILAGADPGNTMADKIQQILSLESKGGQVLTFGVDVTNKEEMQALFTRTQETFGTINGIIHAAGDTGNSAAKSLEQITESQCNQHFLPKIDGLLTLEALIKNNPLDFCLLTSSLSPILGGLGFAAYAAANHFMDAFAHYYQRLDSSRWFSVNWADWNFDNNGKPKIEENSRTGWRMTPEEGIETFRRILNYSKDNQVVVSTVDLQLRINRWVKMESLRDQRQHKKDLDSYRSRPLLENAYVRPDNWLEQTIANILQDFLGIRQVGINDNFFELGATSLNIININNQLREKLQQDIPIVLWFDNPTISALSRHLLQEKSVNKKIPGEETNWSNTMSRGKSKLKQMKRITEDWIGELDA
jgi:NAD(P)-dependent dehydrogenase (short-subunit alcohol dehydrogenase family)/acyl carrier protein